MILPGLVVAGNAAKQVFAAAALSLSLSLTFSICVPRLVPFTVDDVFLKTWESYSERVRHVPISARRESRILAGTIQRDEFMVGGQPRKRIFSRKRSIQRKVIVDRERIRGNLFAFFSFSSRSFHFFAR